MRKLLYSHESECIQPIKALIEKQNHRTLIMWALDCAPQILSVFEEEYPDDKRPAQAIEAAWKWARGEIKMPAAKKAILEAHNAASDAEKHPAAQAAARAVGHAAATVHVETHALGLVFYGLTAVTYFEPEKVSEKLQWFYDRLIYWESNQEATGLHHPWADFLKKEKPESGKKQF